MFRLRCAIAVCFVALAGPAELGAQWIQYPAAGTPRLKNGSADLRAPTPLTRDGYPDFSGIWGPKAEGPACTGDRPCVEQMPLPAAARNVGSSLKDGLPYQPATAELMKRRATESSKDDPHARCTPPNFPRAWALPQYKRIVQTPGLIVVLHEFNAAYRQIHTDGRPLPKDMHPIWNGYSTARWEGKGRGATLVVESAGFRDELWLDMRGNPMGSAAHVTERIRRPNWGNLEIEVTVDDPKLYTKPWTVRMDQWAVPDTDLIDEICIENEKDVPHLVGQ